MGPPKPRRVGRPVKRQSQSSLLLEANARTTRRMAGASKQAPATLGNGASGNQTYKFKLRYEGLGPALNESQSSDDSAVELVTSTPKSTKRVRRHQKMTGTDSENSGQSVNMDLEPAQVVNDVMENLLNLSNATGTNTLGSLPDQRRYLGKSGYSYSSYTPAYKYWAKELPSPMVKLTLANDVLMPSSVVLRKDSVAESLVQKTKPKSTNFSTPELAQKGRNSSSSACAGAVEPTGTIVPKDTTEANLKSGIMQFLENKISNENMLRVRNELLDLKKKDDYFQLTAVSPLAAGLLEQMFCKPSELSPLK